MKKTSTLALACSAALSLSLQSAPAQAQSSAEQAPICALDQDVSPTQHLRRLSLDLRLATPEYSEYEELQGQRPDDNTIDQLLADDAFKDFVARYHADLLWFNVSNVALAAVNVVIDSLPTHAADGSGMPGQRVLQFVGSARRQQYRQGDFNCGDYQQTEWCDADDISNKDLGCALRQGNKAVWAPLAIGMPKRKPIDVESGTGETIAYLDGWVETSAYWDPPTCSNGNECASRQCNAGSCAKVKVCALDAQENENWSPQGSPDPVADSCNELNASKRTGCGCGPNLNYCWTGPAQGEIRAAMRAQMLRLIEDATSGDLGYSEMLTTKRTYYNGPLYQWKRYLAQMTPLNKTFNRFFKGDAPQKNTFSFSDTELVAEERDKDSAHSGILTLPAFSLRFQTNRGRANRIRTVFMGKYFEPPSGALQPGCIEDSDDLTERCYCMHCHVELEPMAAYFGAISEAGSSLITDSSVFPQTAYCDDEPPGSIVGLLCNRFYLPAVNGPDGQYALAPLEFANADGTAPQRQILENFAAGPNGLAANMIADGSFHRTTVKNLWRYFMKRDFDLSNYSDSNEAELLEQLSSAFKSHDNFKAIVKTIVMRPEYRRIR